LGDESRSRPSFRVEFSETEVEAAKVVEVEFSGVKVAEVEVLGVEIPRSVL
jgi:hypothetical protein